MNYKYQYVKNISKGYIGNNEIAAKVHEIKWKHKKYPLHTIEIKKGLPKKVRKNTEAHELAEVYIEKIELRKGHTPIYAYHKGHKFALKYEKTGKPFPKKDIKRKLESIGFIDKNGRLKQKR